MIVPDRVRAAQIRSIYRNTPPGLVATSVALGGFTIVLAYIDAVSVQGAVVLVALIVAQTVARLLLTRAHGRSVEVDLHWREWGRRFAAGAIVGGLTIGGGVAWIMSTGRVDLQTISLLTGMRVHERRRDRVRRVPARIHLVLRRRLDCADDLAAGARRSALQLAGGDVRHLVRRRHRAGAAHVRVVHASP